MAEATPPTLAARNAYALVLVVLMVIFVSQAGGVIDPNVYIEVLFYLAASSYLVSWYYYNWKQEDTQGNGGTESGGDGEGAE